MKHASPRTGAHLPDESLPAYAFLCRVSGSRQRLQPALALRGIAWNFADAGSFANMTSPSPAIACPALLHRCPREPRQRLSYFGSVGTAFATLGRTRSKVFTFIALR
jgi:hypothetical protein